MGRKLKFDVRKKTSKSRSVSTHTEIPESVSDSLVVRVPLFSYTSAKVDDSTVLPSRLIQIADLIPSGWLLTEEHTDTHVVVVPTAVPEVALSLVLNSE